MEVLISQISPNPQQPRTYFDPGELEELADSIREHGVIQAVSLEEREDGQGYYLEGGERRWRAAQLAGLTTIPATINPSRNGSGAKTRLVRALVENIQRADMNVVEAGKAYRELRDIYHMTIREIARSIGKRGAGGEAHVSLRLRIVDELDEPIQKLIAAGKLHQDRKLVDALLTISDPETRIKLAERFAEKKFTLSGCLSAIQRLHQHLAAQPLNKTDIPAIHLANRKTEPGEPPKWNALVQLGNAPLWKHVESSAMATCKACILAPNASETVCGQCPLVVMLIQLKAVGGKLPKGKVNA